MKLTKPQALALQVLADHPGPVAVHGRTRPNAAGRLARVAWAPTSNLVAAGLAVWCDGPSWYTYATITDAGRRWLADNPERKP